MSDLVFTCTQTGDLPVHDAADTGHLEVVKYLLDVQPDMVSVEGRSELRNLLNCNDHESISKECAPLANECRRVRMG